MRRTAQRLAVLAGSLAVHAVILALLALGLRGARIRSSEEVVSGIWGTGNVELDVAGSLWQPPAAVSTESADSNQGREVHADAKSSSAPEDWAPGEGRAADEAPPEARAVDEAPPGGGRGASRGGLEEELGRTKEPQLGDPDPRGSARGNRLTLAPRSGVNQDRPGRAEDVGGQRGGAAASHDHGSMASDVPQRAEGGRRGQLPAAFTRALPAAAQGDKSWHGLDVGPIGRWVVQAQLNEGGELSSLELKAGPERSYLERLLRVTRALLRAGRFALPEGTTGEHRLGLELVLEQGDAGEGEPHHVRQLASRYPSAEEPGEALIVFNSGRSVKIRVFLEPRW